MAWELTLTVLLGSVILLMMAGIPVVFAFLAVNVVGAWLVLGGSAGMELLIRNAFDTRYIPLAFPYPGLAPSGFVGEMGAPRTVSFAAGVRF